MKKFLDAYGSSMLLLACMVIGGVIGAFWGSGASVLQPVADLFLNLLYCCVVPLIFCSLTAAIARMSNLSKLGRILAMFIGFTLLSGVVACLFMVAGVVLFDPSKGVQIDLTQHVKDLKGKLDILGMFTVGDFPALFSKANLMALIIFSILFAISIILAGDKGRPVLDFMASMSAVVVKLVGVVMKLAPIGLGCYFCILIGQNGNQVVGPLAGCVIIYLVVILIYFVVSQTVFAWVGAGWAGVRAWWRTCIPATLTALGTCSSAATLPVNLVQAKQLGIPDDIADLAVPLGANLHKDGACIIQIVKVAFLFGVFGMEYATPQNIALSIAVAVIASVVMGGIPAGGYVAEIFIISVFGFPTVAVPIMVLIGTITDAPATAVNVTGDTGLAMMIARFIEGRDWFSKAHAEKDEKAKPEVAVA